MREYKVWAGHIYFDTFATLEDAVKSAPRLIKQFVREWELLEAPKSFDVISEEIVGCNNQYTDCQRTVAQYDMNRTLISVSTTDYRY